MMKVFNVLLVMLSLAVFISGGAAAELAAYYSFDSSTALNTDDSGNGNDLLNDYADEPNSIEGVSYTAANFDGVTQGYDIKLADTNPAIYPDGAFTVTTWVNPIQALANSGDAVSRPASGDGGFALWIDGSPLTWRVTLYSDVIKTMNSGVYLQYGQWSHLAFVYEPDGAPDENGIYTGTLKFYADGVLANTDENIKYKQGGYRFGLGNKAGGNLFFGGAIDEFAVWDMILSEEHISLLAANAYKSNLLPEVVEQISGDINGDGIVDLADFSVFASQWLTTSIK